MESSKTPQKFRVFSKGVSLIGFENSSVIENLSLLLKRPKEKIAAGLMNGQASKLKSFSTLEKAEKTVRRLRAVGLDCYVEDSEQDGSPIDTNFAVPETQTLGAVKDDLEKLIPELRIQDAETTIHPDVSQEPKLVDGDQKAQLSLTNILNIQRKKASQRQKIKKIVLALFLLLSLIIGGLFVFGHWLKGQTPNSLANVEAAIFASHEPSALLFVDLTQMTRALSLSNEPTLAQQSEKAFNALPLLTINAADKTLFQTTDYVLSSTHFDQSGEDSDNWLTALQGDYSQLEIEAELSKHYEVKTLEDGYYSLTTKPKMVTNEDGHECPIVNDQGKSETTTLHAFANKTHIILGTKLEHVQDYLSAKQTIANYTTDKKYDEWQKYRADTLFAASVFDPRVLKSNFIANAASRSLFEEASYQSLGLRGVINPFSQSLRIRFDADVNDEVLANNLALKILNNISKLSAENAGAFPSVIAILRRIEVNSDDALHVALQIDQHLASELQDVVSDFFSMMFSVSPSSETDGLAAPQEVLESEIWDFALNNKFLLESKPAVSDFDKFSPLIIKQGVAIFIDSLGIKPISSFKPELGETLQLALNAKRTAPFGDAFFTWSDSGIVQSLTILDVLDAKGESLLIDERCSKGQFSQDLNHQAGRQTNYSNDVIDTLKNVRLKSRTRVEDIEKVLGRYKLKVPSNVSTRTISAFNSPSNLPNGSFTLTDNRKGRVSFILSDPENHLLEIRGLNKSGKALQSAISFSSGQRHTKEFQGDVTSIELVIAGAFEIREFDFTLESLLPKRKTKDADISKVAEPRLFNKSDIKLFTKQLSLSNLDDKSKKAITRKLSWTGYSLDSSNEHEIGMQAAQASAVFFRHDASSSWRHELEGMVLVPHHEGLHSSDDLIKIVVNIDDQERNINKIELSKTTVNGEVVASVSDEVSINHDMGTFKVKFEEKRGPLNNLAGRIEYTLPTKIEKTTLKQFESDQLKAKGLSLIGYDFGFRAEVSYALNGALSEAFLVILTSNDGKQSLGRIDREDGLTTLKLERLSGHEKLDFYFIKSAEKVVHRFDFEPSYDTQNQ